MNALPGQIKPALPGNLEVEQALLGAILLNGEAYWQVSSFLQPKHFLEPVHRKIFEVAGDMVKADKRPTPINIKTYLPADLAIGDTDLAHYVARLAASATTVINADSYGQTIFDLALRRDALVIGEDLTAAAYSMPVAAGAKAIIEDAELRLMELGEEAASALLSRDRTDASFDAVVGEAEARMVSGERFKGPRCGFVDLDDKLGGFAPGELILLAGRPGMGKTALAVAMFRKAAHLGIGVGFDTIEMMEAALKQRIIADECEAGGVSIAYSAIGRGRLEPAQVAAMKRAAARLRELPMVVIDRGNRLADIAGHIRLARRMLAKKQRELEIFWIDYLGLLIPSDRYAGQRTNEVSEISATVKALAKREGIAIVGLQQLSRASAARGGDYRPRLEDLRDSGALEQDADAVLFVYREEYYIEHPGYRQFKEEGDKIAALLECQNKMEVIVAKQRQGPIGTVKLYFDSATNAVRDAAR